MAVPGVVKALVMDSGPLIKGAKPETLSSDVFTIREVVSEIRDAATRQRLSVLPYELKFREPSPASIKFVSDFAKKTGDFHVLSLIDVKVMALTYQLMLESDPSAAESIRQSPVTATQGAATVMQPTSAPLSGHIAGFYVPKSGGKETVEASEVECDGDGEDGDENEEEEDDDDEGWITPSNIARMKKEMNGGDVEAVSSEMGVACMTTDYAMQNVLMQIGLPVLSVDGMVIRTVRSYVMRCTACMKVSTKVSSAFCPNCGNDALVRVVANTSDAGQVSYGGMGPKALSQRGVRYSLPLPKGGRLAVNPVVNPDQHTSYCPPRSRAAPLNALEDDFVGHSSPFAMNDVSSRGVNIAFRNKSHNSAATQRAPGQRRKNPNASRPKGGKKK